MFSIKRIYEEADEKDGARILIDRLWARGISKEKAHLNLWLKDIAPSDALREWFNHDPKKWPEFERKYKAELKTKTELIDQLKKLEKQHKQITLLYGAKDSEHNNAVVLKNYLQS